MVEGAAFCMARHEADRQVRSWAELRGVSFHTDRSGFEDTSTWVRHGVMLVDRGQGIEAWNWSPRALRFDRLARARDLVATPFGVCQPVADFGGRMSIV